MDALDLVEIVKKGEDSHLQFKERIDSVNALAAELCAFSNSDGGKLLVGVSDHGDIIGLTGEQVGILNQHISNACSQKINPPVSVTTENI
ncbi:MAG: ATP-binding protein, partial [Bacteroidota bacterium]